VKNITGPSGKAAALDASNQDSPNDHKEVKAGFRDGGTVTIEANWYPGDANGQGRMLTAFQAGTLNDFKIVAHQPVELPKFGHSAASSPDWNLIIRSLV
jgi:hypothetical protein